MSHKIVFNPTEADLARIYTLAQMGLPFPNIAESFGMSYETLNRLRKKIPALDKALTSGLAAGNEIIVGQLFKGVMEGNMTAIIFASKVRVRMSETQKVELVGVANIALTKINFTSMTPIEAARVYQQIMKGEK